MRWAFAAVLAAVWVPEVWAQADYSTLTRTDADYLYMGIAMQQLLRQSPTLRFVPAVIVTCCLLYMLLRRAVDLNPEPLAAVFAYFGTTLVILTLFWPETTNFLGAFKTVAPAAVQDEISNDPDAAISSTAPTNAKEGLAVTGGGLNLSGMVGTAGARVPMAFHLILQALVDVPVKFAQAINLEANRPFDELVSFHTLDNMVIPSGVSSLLSGGFFRDKTVGGEACYGAAAAKLVAGGLTTNNFKVEEHYPWVQVTAPAKNLRTYLSQESISIMGRYKRYAIRDGGGTVSGTLNFSCDEVYDYGWEGAMVSYLNNTTTRSGATFGTAIEDATGIGVTSQARYLWTKHASVLANARLQETVGTGSYDMLQNRYLIANVGAMSMKAAEGAMTGGWAGAGVGLAQSLFSRVGGEVDRIVQWMQPALVLLMFAPYVTGIISATALAFFPLVVLWSMFPRQHFKPLINYFLLLLFTQSAPLWWAIGDALADVAREYMGAPGTDVVSQGIRYARGNAAGVVVGVLSVFMVPVVQAIVMFGSWRVVGGMFKGF